MVTFIFLVALANLAVGFAVAVALGGRRRPALAVAAAPTSAPSALPLGTPAAPPPAAPSTLAPPTPASAPAATTSVPAVLDACGLSLLRVEMEVDRYQNCLAVVDEELRQCAASPAVDRIETAMAQLAAANHEFVERRAEVGEELAELRDAQAGLGPACDAMQAELDEQIRKIESLEETIGAFDYSGDLAEGCRGVLGEAVRLTEGVHRIHDAVDEAKATAAREAGSTAPAQDRPDALTQLPGRMGLESALRQWHAAGAADRPFSVVQIDLDQFSRVNERFGPRLGDRVLKALAQLLDAECRQRPSARLFRVGGDSFVATLVDESVQQAAAFAERARQTVELARFSGAKEPIQVSVSCAIAGAAPQDDIPALLARAGAALKEAKRYGRNRSFVHEGKYPTPVVPPTFELTTREIPLP